MKGEKLYLKASLLHSKMYEYPNHLTESEKKKLYKEYVNLLRKSAYLGNAKAQYDLGQQYETMNFLHIHNPNHNPKKCVYWYTKACMQDHAEACNNLATFFESGIGCRQNLNKALALYKKSAMLGSTLGKKNYKIMQNQLNVNLQRKVD